MQDLPQVQENMEPGLDQLRVLLRLPAEPKQLTGKERRMSNGYVKEGSGPKGPQ
jgi:hypothetical protein